MIMEERKNNINSSMMQNIILENRELSLDNEEVIVEGEINSLSYSEKDMERKSGSLLGKIFK